MIRALFNKGIWWINILAVLALLVTYLAPGISPISFWPLAFGGLIYPFVLLINVLFVLYWLIGFNPRFLLSLIMILLGWNSLNSFIALNVRPAKVEVDDKKDLQLKVMTYNVQNFDLYNWNENEVSRDNMMDIIEEENPDILCFQEFYYENSEDFHNVKLLVNKYGYKYYHLAETYAFKDTHFWGVALFSKYPLEDKASIEFENSATNAGVQADAMIDGKKVRLLTVHLESIKLGSEDYKYLKNIGEKVTDWSSQKNILKKLRSAFHKRAEQAEYLNSLIARSPFPVLLMGDFNDTSNSYTYRRLAENMQDAFLKVGWGTGGTYAGPLPSFRIDYILADQGFDVKDFKLIKKKYSDHYPITSTLVLKDAFVE